DPPDTDEPDSDPLDTDVQDTATSPPSRDDAQLGCGCASSPTGGAAPATLLLSVVLGGLLTRRSRRPPEPGPQGPRRAVHRFGNFVSRERPRHPVHQRCAPRRSPTPPTPVCSAPRSV